VKLRDLTLVDCSKTSRHGRPLIEILLEVYAHRMRYSNDDVDGC
jgi:hypothetical protein